MKFLYLQEVSKLYNITPAINETIQARDFLTEEQRQRMGRVQSNILQPINGTEELAVVSDILCKRNLLKSLL